jgi:hypothetical protein
MSIIYPNGAGETLGDTLVTCRPLYTSGNIWYVNSNGGVDAATPAGQNREKPLATLVQAFINANDNDIICLMTGHTETLVAPLDLTRKVTIVGGGSAGGKPTVKIYQLASESSITIDSPNIEIRNVWFPPGGATSPRIDVSGASFRMIGCYMECGPNDLVPGVRFETGADRARIVNTTIISTATSVSAQPESAIAIQDAISDLELDGLVLSGGTVGFSNYNAFDSADNAITRLKGQSVSLLLGADMHLNAATTGWLNVQTSTGGARVQW